MVAGSGSTKQPSASTDLHASTQQHPPLNQLVMRITAETYWSSKPAGGRHRFLSYHQQTTNLVHNSQRRLRQACFSPSLPPGECRSRVQRMKKLNPISWTSEEFLTLHTECTLGQRAKGQRGIHPRPGRQAGRQALFKQARNAWFEERRRRRRRRGRNLYAIKMS